MNRETVFLPFNTESMYKSTVSERFEVGGITFHLLGIDYDNYTLFIWFDDSLPFEIPLNAMESYLVLGSILGSIQV
jgi:hypothetical protein